MENVFIYRWIATALGPLFLGPLSELYGRSRVLQLANLWYLGKFTAYCMLPIVLLISPLMQHGIWAAVSLKIRVN